MNLWFKNSLNRWKITLNDVLVWFFLRTLSKYFNFLVNVYICFSEKYNTANEKTLTR